MKNYLNLAYYYLTKIEDPEKEVLAQQKFFKNKDIKGRIYISEQGINGQVSCHKNEKKAFTKYLLHKYPKITIKGQLADTHAFDKMHVKYRKQLVALDRYVDLSKRSKSISAEKWKEMLENMDENTILIDVRNDYEWKIGHFENAELPACKTFREFPKYTKDLKKRKDPKKTKVLMYCTGGIRCEFYSAFLKEEGYEEIYPLEGGVIQYGEKVGAKHWRGKLFVFDDRLVVPISDEKGDVISACQFCQKKCATYYNCANMDCNELFLSCSNCISKHTGCCSQKCQKYGRVREYDANEQPKPFRKLSFDAKKVL